MKGRRDPGDDGQGFLFVNKSQTSKSLSKSDGSVAKLINRHAQRVQIRKTETQRINSLKTDASAARRIALNGWLRRDMNMTLPNSNPASPSSPAAESWNVATPPHRSSRTESPNHVTTPSDHASCAASPPSSSEAGSGHGNDRHVGSPPGLEDDPQEDGEVLILSAPVYQANLAFYDCVDPFGVSPVRVTSSMHSVLQHILQVYSYSGNNYKLAHLPSHLRPTMPQFPITSIVQRSVHKEHHLYSLMAAATARMKYVWREQSPVGDPRVIHGLAVRHLRKELLENARSGTIDKQTIMDLVFLVVSETQYGYYDKARKHLQIIARLYHLLDHTEYLDHWISESTAHVDNQLALVTGEPLLLPYDFDPGPMLPERMSILKREAKKILMSYGYPNPISMLVSQNAPRAFTDAMQDLSTTLDHRMGTKLRRGINAGMFAGKFATIMSDLADCIDIAKVVWLSPIAVCFDAEWLCRKARSVLRSLLALSPPNSLRPMGLFANCGEAVRLCSVLAMTHACTLIGTQTAQANVRRLREACNDAFNHWTPTVSWTADCRPMDPTRKLGMFEETQAGFALWSTLIGVWSSTGMPQDEKWFITRAVNLSVYFGYSCYEDLDSHMSQYIYSRTLQDASLRKTAYALQSSLRFNSQVLIK